MFGDRGQSEVVGVVLLLGLTLLVTGLIVSYAGAAIDGTQEEVVVESATQSLTQLDSKAALVALGRTDSQSLSLGRTGEGHYEVNPGAGWIRIAHVNYTSGRTETVLEKTPLGEVVYTIRDRRVAFQGGGVWRQHGNGSVMVAPPEFHYRGETLTFPIVRVDGLGAVSGSAFAQISAKRASVPVYPNASATYDTGLAYANPIENGTFVITLKSDYYQGWKSFFEDRTDANVTVDAANQTVTARLAGGGAPGDFQLQQTLQVRGLGDGHALTSLNLSIADQPGDSADFADLDWSLYVDEGNEVFEMNLYSDDKPSCGERVGVTLYYSPGPDSYQAWTNENAFEVKCPASGQKYIAANFTGTVELRYTEDVDLVHADESGELTTPLTIDAHTDAVDWESTTISAGQTLPIRNLTRHYFAFLGPNFELRTDDGNEGRGQSGSVSVEDSQGTLEYESSGRVVTFVHVTVSRVRITLR